MLIWSNATNGPWYVQPTNTQDDGSWFSDAHFGRDPKHHPEDIGSDFIIVAILTNEPLKAGPSYIFPEQLLDSSNTIKVIRSSEQYEV